MPATRVKPTNPKLRRGRGTTQIYAAWPFAHRSIPAADYVAGNAMAAVGTASIATGPDGPAASLPGGANYFATTNPIFDPAADFSAAILFAANSLLAGSQSLLAHESGAGTGRTWLQVGPSATGGVLQSTFGSGGTTRSGVTPITPGVLHWAVLTYGASSTTETMYLDGNQEQTWSTAAEANAGARLRVGINRLNGSSFVGTVSQMILWNRALTPTEVLRLCSQPYRIWTPRKRWAMTAVRPAGTAKHFLTLMGCGQ